MLKRWGRRGGTVPVVAWLPGKGKEAGRLLVEGPVGRWLPGEGKEFGRLLEEMVTGRLPGNGKELG